MRSFIPGLLIVIVLLSCGAGTTVPAGSTIKSDEKVVFFTTAATWDGSAWVAPIHGWIFEPEEDSLWRQSLVDSLRAVLRVKTRQEALFRKHLRWFLVDNERGKKITVSAGGVQTTLPRSRSNGHFKGTMRLPGSLPGSHRESVTVAAATRTGDSRRFASRVLLVPETGISVISDIDDTIKVTHAWDRRRTLEKTFLEPFHAVPGMASLYRRWKQEGAVFHYVSAGPWQLFVPLTEFMERVAFPEGTMHLKDFRLKDSTGFSLLEKPTRHKVKTIEELLARHPQRSFVLVGDSGQLDPEIYADIARRHPQQIRAIYIRSVSEPIATSMPAHRQKAVNAGLTIPVHVFIDPAALTL
jgi:phosphatidate phosphatase APP1